VNRIVLAIVVAVAVAGCNLSLYTRSLPPPGRTARLERVEGWWRLKYYRADISEGVALGIACEKSGPCQDMVVKSSDQSIVEVTPAAIARLEPVGISGDQRSAASFVLIGKKAGTAKVFVTSHDGGNRWIRVTVLPPPTPAPVMVDRATASK
jgi:hypothetical protein